MRAVPHPHERRGNSRERCREPQRALRIRRTLRKELAYLVREPGREPPLHERCTRDDADPQRICGLEQRDHPPAERLGLYARGLGHREAQRELDESEVMVRTGDLARDVHQLGEREMLAVLRPDAEAQPGRTTVAHDLSALCRFLEEREGGSHAAPELCAVHAEQLLLRIVEVVHIERLEPQVGSALRELVRQE